MNLIGPINSGPAVGADGVATANADTSTPVNGLVVGAYIKYNLTPPNTTDVTISTKGTSPRAPSLTILAVANANTDGWFFPCVAQVIPTNVASGSYMPVPVADILNVKIEGANALDNVDVWLLVE